MADDLAELVLRQARLLRRLLDRVAGLVMRLAERGERHLHLLRGQPHLARQAGDAGIAGDLGEDSIEEAHHFNPFARLRCAVTVGISPLAKVFSVSLSPEAA